MEHVQTVLHADIENPPNLAEIIEFFNGSKGFSQKLWSKTHPVLSPDRQYDGRISPDHVRISYESQHTWLRIGLGHHQAVNIPLYGEQSKNCTKYRIVGDTIVFAVYDDDEAVFERHITRRK